MGIWRKREEVSAHEIQQAQEVLAKGQQDLAILPQDLAALIEQ